jgi:hypothetical protein
VPFEIEVLVKLVKLSKNTKYFSNALFKLALNEIAITNGAIEHPVQATLCLDRRPSATSLDKSLCALTVNETQNCLAASLKR